MSTILSRLVAVGIIAGGFALTGDLGRLASRGLAVLNARDVPHPPSDAPPTKPSTPTPTPVPGRPMAVPHDADFRPPRDGLDRVDLVTLSAGSRIVIWLAVPRGFGGRAYRCLVFDVIDAAEAEALAYEAVSLAADGSPRATASPPHRVRLRGDGPGGMVTVGGSVAVQRRGVAADGVGEERLGPVVALGLVTGQPPRTADAQ